LLFLNERMMLMKILIAPSEYQNITEYNDCNGVIVGLKKFSVFIPLELTIDEIKKMTSRLKQEGKEIFVSVNKMMYNEDIPLLKEYLLILDSINVTGIIYDDLAVLNIVKNLKLNIPLVWFGIHSFTNYYTSNYWYEKGVKYGVLSTEITLDQIKKISNNTKLITMMYGYGYLPMFVSARPLITSYFKHINKPYEKKVYNMYESQRNKTYPTIENEEGTIILSSDIINTIEELPDISKMVDYLILSSLNISKDKFTNIYEYYIKALSFLDNKEELKKISQDVSNESDHKTDKGFLYKETVYRVKNSDN